MEISVLSKIKIILKYIFSSFLSVETFILSLLIFLILIFNLRKKNRYVNIIALGIYIGFIIGIFISYSGYVKVCFSSFLKTIISYIYFPSTFLYFTIFIFITLLMVHTIFSKKMKNFKKSINYLIFSLMYFLFMSFIILCIYSGVDIYNNILLYKNNIILSIVQVSNVLFNFWLVFTFFYYLYQYFKKFDKKNK